MYNTCMLLLLPDAVELLFVLLVCLCVCVIVCLFSPEGKMLFFGFSLPPSFTHLVLSHSTSKRKETRNSTPRGRCMIFLPERYTHSRSPITRGKGPFSIFPSCYFPSFHPQKTRTEHQTTGYTYIGRHDGGSLKVDSLDIGLDSSHLLDGHVGQSLKLKWHNHRDGKRRLDRGFVPARERLASIAGLELSHGHVLCLAFLVLVLRAIESVHPVVDLAIEFNFENCGSLGQGVGELECGNLVLGSIDRRRLVTNVR